MADASREQRYCAHASEKPPRGRGVGRQENSYSLRNSASSAIGGLAIRVVEVLPPLVDTPSAHPVRPPKMSPELLVDEVLRDIRRKRDEILTGIAPAAPVRMPLIRSYRPSFKVAESQRRNALSLASQRQKVSLMTNSTELELAPEVEEQVLDIVSLFEKREPERDFVEI